MNDSEEEAKWEEACKAFGKFADGFLVMAYVDNGKTKLIKGGTNDHALRDALFLVEVAAAKWLLGQNENMLFGLNIVSTLILMLSAIYMGKFIVLNFVGVK